MDFNSISKNLQDSIVNVTKGLSEEDNIVGVIDGVRSDRKYNDADHAHNSLSKLVAYQKAKKAELYVNGEKTKHYELNKNYNDFEPKKLSEESIEEEMKMHPMALHVKPVKVNGKTKYKVHAVGSELGGGIKVGEHLTDTHLDDATEMGAKIKHLKENQMVDKTIELHDDFIIDLPSELGFQDYLDAAKSFSEDPSEAILIADSFFKSRDESLVIENFMRSDIESKIKAHEKAGSKVDDTKYSTKNGKPYAEYTVTDSEGRKSRYIHHGSTRRVER
jgi:hypothetical protein